jgi:hypothetical protein
LLSANPLSRGTVSPSTMYTATTKASFGSIERHYGVHSHEIAKPILHLFAGAKSSSCVPATKVSRVQDCPCRDLCASEQSTLAICSGGLLWTAGTRLEADERRELSEVPRGDRGIDRLDESAQGGIIEWARWRNNFRRWCRGGRCRYCRCGRNRRLGDAARRAVRGRRRGPPRSGRGLRLPTVVRAREQ